MLNFFRWTGLGLPALLVLGGCGNSTSPHTVAPALGAEPTGVTVETPGGTHTWQGFVSKISGGVLLGGGDSAFSLVAYSDYNLTHVVVASVFYANGQTYPSIEMIAGDTSDQFGGSGTITAATMADGAPCVAATGFQNRWARYAANCTLATFRGGLSWNVPLIGQVTIAAQTFNGVNVK